VPLSVEERALRRGQYPYYGASGVIDLVALLDESFRAVSLLKERRSTLISAAITGQIDVRGLTEIPD
jgi:hypothetical protein